MENSNENIEFAKVTAFYAYLEFCNAINEVPKKEVYNLLKDAKSSQDLEKATTFMEREESQYLKQVNDLRESKESIKKSLFSQFLELFK